MTRRASRFCTSVTALFFCAGMAWGQAPYKIEPVPLPAAGEFPAPLVALLQTQGSRVVDSKGATVCELWLGKTIPLNPTPTSSPDIMYGQLELGTLIGALHFPQAGSDFRGQPIKAGYYTLRYALMPQDGNHMGANPTRDFVLLCPAALDTNLNQALKFDDVVKLSRQASGTNHPAILTMDPPDAAKAKTPSVSTDDQSYWALQATAQTKAAGGSAADLPLAIVVVGQTSVTE